MKRKIDRQDILNAGRDLMFLNGYTGTGIKDITDAIEIPKGSFYNHFSSKEDFGLEVLRQYAENGLKIHRDNFLDEKVEPLKRIEKFYGQSIEIYRKYGFEKGCIMSNFSSELGDTNERFREVLDKEFNAQESMIVECIREGQEFGDIRKDLDPQTLGAFVINSWHGSLVRMKATASAQPMQDFVSMIIEFLKK